MCSVPQVTSCREAEAYMQCSFYAQHDPGSARAYTAAALQYLLQGDCVTLVMRSLPLLTTASSIAVAESAPAAAVTGTSLLVVYFVITRTLVFSTNVSLQTRRLHNTLPLAP